MSTNPMTWAGYPRSYTAGRRRAPKLLVVHYTAGNEGPTSAENGIHYDKIRTDGISCHAFFDSEGPGLQEVPFGDRSHSAFFYGNEIGVHYEICGTRQTREQWLDGTSQATLVTCAAATAYACETLGLQKRRLTDGEVRRAWDVGDIGGICDHWAITRVFGRGDHTDVGPEFPWDVFTALVNGGGSSGGGWDMYCKRGDTGPNVQTLQEQGLRAGGVLPQFGADGGYGQETANMVAGLGLHVQFGNGKPGDPTGNTYGSVEFANLQRKVAQVNGGGAGTPGPAGPPGPQGPPGPAGPKGEDGLGVGDAVTITGTVTAA